MHLTARRTMALRSSCRNLAAKQLRYGNGVPAIICHLSVPRTRSSMRRMDALSKSYSSGRNSGSRGTRCSSTLAASDRQATERSCRAHSFPL